MSRQTALIVTLASAVLCGCPGLFTAFGGGMFALISFIPGAEIDVFGSSDPASALRFGLGGLCAGTVLLVIPLVVWFFTLRRAPRE